MPKKNDYDDYLDFASLSASNGDVFSSNGDFEKAEYFYNRAVKFYKLSSKTDIRDLAHILECLGDLNCQHGNYVQANSYYDEAQKIYEDIKDNYHLAIVLRNRSLCYYFKDDLFKTIEFLKRSFSLFEIFEKSNDFTEINKDSFNREFFITCVFLYRISLKGIAQKISTNILKE